MSEAVQQLVVAETTDAERADEVLSRPAHALITGVAGTGKTHLVRERIARDPNDGVLAATTGISAVNLGTTTINALLSYFDTDSLRRAYVRGSLVTKLARLATQYRKLYLDECSMLDAAQLEILHDALREANSRAPVLRKNPQGMWLALTGDFAQLPPVRARWCFEAECWEAFDRNTVRLTKNWRQSDAEFLSALNAVRRGDGASGSALLRAAGVEFSPLLDLNFDGTTILPRNDEVDRFNAVRLKNLPGETIHVPSERWVRLDEHRKRAPREWDQIPEQLEIKRGAYCMILSNDSPMFSFANGDCGYVVDYDLEAEEAVVRLVRNGAEVRVRFVERKLTSQYNPLAAEVDDCGIPKEPLRYYSNAARRAGEPRPREVHFDEQTEAYVLGCVRFLPLRLAYASTVEKSQGLTLDRVQIDVRNRFFGNPGKAYVALSRSRTPRGLRIVGTADLLAKRTIVAPEVTRWL